MKVEAAVEVMIAKAIQMTATVTQATAATQIAIRTIVEVGVEVAVGVEASPLLLNVYNLNSSCLRTQGERHLPPLSWPLRYCRDFLHY